MIERSRVIAGRKSHPPRTFIIHVSGMPGSGKSTLGEKITSTFGYNRVHVIDTDHLIQRNTPNGDDLLELEKLSSAEDPGGEKYNARWRDIFSTEIQASIDQARRDGMSIVFVGILDHFGHHSDPIEIEKASHRYYIDIKPSKLLFQFYTRYAKLFHDERDPFWFDLANGRENIPSSEQYMADSIKTGNWHIAHGYVLKTTESILTEIKELLS